jgi:nucleotide-binding universal stress UspA family protein
MPSFKRILVPIDGSDTSTKALTTALQLARDAGGRVRVLNAIDELAYHTGYEQSARILQAAREASALMLAKALEVAKAAGVEADSVLSDDPGQRLGQTVARAASDWEADLVVVGTHGRRGVSRILLGSGAEQVIRLAPVPVLVVRGEEGA